MRRWHSFTLIELLIVIAIIAILASMLLPSLQRARDNSKSIACLNNCKTLTAGLSNYADTYKGYCANVSSWYLDIYTAASGHDNRNGRRDAEFKKHYTNFIWCPGARFDRNLIFGEISRTAYTVNCSIIPYGYNNYAYVGLKLPKVVRPSMVVFFGDSDEDGYADYVINMNTYPLGGNRHNSRASLGYADGHAAKEKDHKLRNPTTIYGRMKADGKTDVKSSYTDTLNHANCGRYRAYHWGVTANMTTPTPFDCMTTFVTHPAWTATD